MEPLANDQATRQTAPAPTNVDIALRYALVQLVGGIAVGAFVGIVFYGILGIPSSLLVKAICAVTFMFAVFWRQAKRHPEGYWTHGPLVALSTAFLNVLFSWLSGPMSSGTLILAIGFALAASFVAMEVAGRIVLGRSKVAGG